MKSLLIYLLQVIVASGILYGYYHLALRNKKFHRYNRFYLLGAFVISIIVPFFNIPVYFTNTDTDSSFILHTLTSFSSQSPQEVVAPIMYIAPEKTNWFTWQHLSYLFYIIIAFIVMIRILFSLKKIRHIIRNNPVEKLEDIHFVNTDEPGTPFSFFRWMFWNRRIELQSEKGEQIFRHELFHIQQRHSRDIIFMELMMVVFWINPFFHLIKKEVKAIHEFLADQFAVKEETKWQYAELLLMQALNTNQNLVNPFFHNQIKRRIAMITTSQKLNYRYFRKLMVLPVAAVVIILFAFKYKSIDDNKKDIIGKTNIVADTTNPEQATLKEIALADAAKSKIEIRLNGDTYIYADTMLFDGASAINAKIISKDSSNPLIVLNGKALKGVGLKDINDIIKPDMIQSINVLKGPSAAAEYGSQVKDGVIEIITRKNTPDMGIKEMNPGDTIKPEATDNKIFDKVEIAPSFPGGKEKWKQYLAKNANGLIPINNGVPEGDYTVIVQFIVDKEGNIHNIKTLTHHGYGMEEEAIRLIAKGPKWIPAVQNGHVVRAYKKQPITFSITDGVDHKTKSGITTKYDQNISISNVENSSKKEITSRQLPEIVVTGFGNENNNETKQSYVNMPILPPVEAGSIEWRRFFERNLNPNLAIKEYWQPGTYKLYMQFSTDQDGVISDAEILNYSNSETARHCLDLLRHIPKLIPENGSAQRSKMIYFQPLIFIIEDINDKSIPKITKKDFQKSSVNKLLELNEETEILSYGFAIYFPNGVTETKNMGSLLSNESKMLVNRAEPGTIFSLNYPRIIKNRKEMSASSKIYRLAD